MNKYSPLPVAKWDKESLTQNLQEQYIRTVTKIMRDKRFSEFTRDLKLDYASVIFYSLYEPVINDRITYKKLV